MVKNGRQGFGLAGNALEDFVRRFVIEMVKGGAVPVVGDKTAASGWRQFQQYGSDPNFIAEAVVKEWKESGIDPDVEGIWFAFPNYVG
jgi:hypothetical protein